MRVGFKKKNKTKHVIISEYLSNPFSHSPKPNGQIFGGKKKKKKKKKKHKTKTKAKAKRVIYCLSNSRFKLTSERKKEEKKKKKKKKKKDRENREEIGPRQERKEGTEDRWHGVDVGARRSARSNSGEGQRAAAATEGGWVEKNLRCGFNFQSKRL